MSIEHLQDDLGDFIIDGKGYSFSELTPDQRERFAKEDWAFRLGYGSVQLGVPVGKADLKALKDPGLMEYFQRGKASAMEDVQFINPSVN